MLLVAICLFKVHGFDVEVSDVRTKNQVLVYTLTQMALFADSSLKFFVSLLWVVGFFVSEVVMQVKLHKEGKVVED